MQRTSTASTGGHIAAAQYLRMSTDDQLNSIATQKDVIEKYATKNGYAVVATYADEGKSGLAIKTRDDLKRLLRDVLSGQAQFRVILVYDVSRWGRFQDLDEAAHYEFVCKSAGIPVRYCAEQFNDDGSMPSSIMKTLKRTMAAEYSRELSIKVGSAMIRLARMGFRACGIAGFGLRRMMVSPDGLKRLILEDGERKAITKYHTILVPGPRREVAIVRKIFKLAAQKRNTPRRIARELNQNKLWPADDRRWCESAIRTIIYNEKYIGSNIYGKTTRKLGGPNHHVPRSEWIIVPNAFAPIVERELFEKVQEVTRRRSDAKPDEYYLQFLRRVFARYGKITEKLAARCGLFAHGTYAMRFGSLSRAYDLVGYVPSPHAFKSVANQGRAQKLRADLLGQLQELYPKNLRLVRLPGQTQRGIIEFNRHVRVAVHICRQVRGTVGGQPRWILKEQRLEAGYPCLICLANSDLTKLLAYYLAPQFSGIIKKYKVLKESHKWLAAGQKLQSLSQLSEIATAMAGEWQKKDDTTIVGDVIFSSRTSALTIANREIALPPIDAELFKLLVLGAGTVVSRRELLHPFTGAEFPSANLNAHIHELRRRLGPQLQKRIRTIKNEGYKYEMPSHFDIFGNA